VNRRRAIARALVVVAAVGAVVLATGTPASAAAATPPRIDRVLVISLPAVTWKDLRDDHLPNLQRLAKQSAVGDLVARVAGHRNSLPSGYAAIGAGGRATALNPLGAQAFNVDEPYGDTTAGDAFAQRTDHPVDSGIVQLGIDLIEEENAEGLYGAHVGALGDRLASAGIARAVIGNGDGAQPVVDDTILPYQRSVANALMDHDGVVPEGDVSTDLLEPDVNSPFGVRLDNDRVVQEFDRVWPHGGVVAVEASDLARVEAYGALETSDQEAQQRLAALRRTDQLVGRLLSQVDPAHDAVMLVSPEAPARGSALTVVSVRAPGFAPGLLRSSTLRRTGFVSLVDVAPTILHLFHIGTPHQMEGEVMESRPSGDAASRETFLVQAGTDGTFRDAHVNSAAFAALGLAMALGVVTALAILRARKRLGALVEWGALAVLGFLAGTYVASLFHFGRDGGNLAFWGFLAVASVAFAAVCRAFRRIDPYAPIIIALLATVALHVGDMLIGARLELNAVFGYSATVGIRVAGQGNLTYAQVTSAAVLGGGLLVWRRPGRSTVYAVIAGLAFTLLVMGLPRWGDDFGAALSAAPAFGLFAWLLLGRRLRWKTVLLLAAALVVSGIAVGFADLLRPADQQTHVGRLFHQIGNEGFGQLFLVLRRKATENFESFTSTKLVWIVPVVAVVLVYLWFAAPAVRRLYHERVVVRQTLLALLVVAVLGYALNDSGIAIPAMMGLVLECVVAYVVVEEGDGDEPAELEAPPGAVDAAEILPEPVYAVAGSRS
jgi:hypothetical protein